MNKNEKKRDAVAAVIWASVSSMCLGVALTIRGVSPLFVHKLVSGELPTSDIVGVQSLVMMVGVVFMGIGILLKRCVVAAAWMGFLLAMLLAGGGIGAAFLVGASFTDIFLFAVCIATCLANLVAIGAINSGNVEEAASPPRRVLQPTTEASSQ